MDVNSVNVGVMSSALVEGVDGQVSIPMELCDDEKSKAWWSRCLAAGLSAMDWIFGLMALAVGLALLSIVPVFNLLSLGYLLEVSGRVARTGKVRSGFVGIRKASRLGSVVIGAWVVLLPLRYVYGMWRDAELIAPASAEGWRLALIALSVVAFFHIAWACVRGGRLWHFLWPAPLRFWRWLGGRGKWGRVWARAWDYVSELNMPYYFWLGARGFVGAVIWLLIPVALLILAAGRSPGLGALLSVLGVLLLTPVVMWLPFLQAHFARVGRFGALFELREIRRLFANAPIAFWLAFFITLLFALPLYLLKIELAPRDLAWLPSLLFILFIFPARLLAGWAMSRAVRRDQRGVSACGAFSRWVSRLAFLPVALIYVLLVYVTQYLVQNGSMSLLEQHAFLVPAPMMGM
ncbi:MAG: hypothetical protein L3J39_10240 [Verrucomicrobiales bacterium]|nr:hypothetical protein [Verrucomicrobiales bacterium]